MSTGSRSNGGLAGCGSTDLTAGRSSLIFPEAYWLESRGPGVPTPDPDGTTPPKGWTPKHAEFLETWNVANPRGSARQAESDMRETGLKARSQTIRERLKCVRDARDAPSAGESVVRPDEDQGPALSEGVAFDPGVAFGGAVGSDEGEIETMTDAERAAAQAETLAMVDDWAAGGERAESRARDNALKGLGLDGDLMKWTDAEWAKLTGHEAAA